MHPHYTYLLCAGVHVRAGRPLCFTSSLTGTPCDLTLAMLHDRDDLYYFDDLLCLLVCLMICDVCKPNHHSTSLKVSRALKRLKPPALPIIQLCKQART